MRSFPRSAPGPQIETLKAVGDQGGEGLQLLHLRGCACVHVAELEKISDVAFAGVNRVARDASARKHFA